MQGAKGGIMDAIYENYTVTEDGRALLKKAENDQVETVWDRHKAQQPHCGYCETGLS